MSHPRLRARVAAKADMWLANPHLARRALEMDVEAITWTVNDPGPARSLLALGVERLTTDEVECIQQVAREHPKQAPRPTT